MIEMIDFFTQIKRSVRVFFYVNGSPFLGKRYLSKVTRERMIEIKAFLTQIK